MSDERLERLKAAETDAKPVNEADIDVEELKSAKDVVVQLVKTAKTLKIYLPNNPVYQKFIQELKLRFDAHLKDYGELKLRVRQYELHHQGQVIYENLNRLESVAFKLYVDGIREISFQEDLDLGEITTFLEIIGREYDPDDPDDDMVTLLWERHLAHINYWVTEDFIQETRSLPEVPTPDVIQDMARKEMAATPKTETSVEDMIQQHLGMRPEDSSWTQIFNLTEEEVASVKKQMESEEHGDSLSILVNILTSILRIERDFKAFSETLEISDGLLETFTVRMEFGRAAQVLQLYHELMGPQQGFSKDYIERLRQSIEKAGQRQRILSMESFLNKAENIDTDHLTSFFLLLNKDTAGPVIDLMGRLTQMKIRRSFCEVLIQLCQENIDPLLKNLHDPRWFVLRNILYILGKIGDPRCLEKVEPLIQHKELKVRKELLHLLEAIKNDNAKKYMILLIQDPETEIRLQAIRFLANSRYEPALEPLLKAANSREFQGKDQIERKEFFEALGRIGGDDLIPFFEKLLRQGMRAWFNKATKEEMALCAVAGLRRIGNDGARAVLEEGLRTSRKRLREACIRAYNEMKG